MQICEECIHYDLCNEYYYTGDLCAKFRNKSKLIELPCDIGDYCIWDDELWYVNGIHYFNDRNGDFLLWMSMADKSPCGAEAISSEVKFISEEEAKKILEELTNEKE